MNTRCVDVRQSVMEFPVKDGTKMHCCSCHEESGLRSCSLGLECSIPVVQQRKRKSPSKINTLIDTKVKFFWVSFQ